MYKTHTCGELRAEHAGQEVVLAGWVHRRRDHGGVIFIDLRDRFGLTQIVANPEIAAEAHAALDPARNEWALKTPMPTARNAVAAGVRGGLVYVALQHRGQRVGDRLYSALLEQLADEDVHRAYAGIAMPNEASIRLHERHGFRRAAYFTEQGRKFVYVVNDQSLSERRDVSLDRVADGLQVVRDGLKPDDWVVVNGIQRVRDGMKVEPRRAPMPGAASAQGKADEAKGK